MKTFRACILACIMLICGLWTAEVKIYAGNDNYPSGARAGGMGNAAVTLCDVWANFYNQAILTELDRTSFGLHHEMRYGMHQLAISAFAISTRAGGGTLGLCASSFGYSGFRENKTGLSYSLKLFKGISAGVQLEYLTMRSADGSPKSKAFTFELGILAELSREIRLGVHIFNPANIHYNGSRGEPIPPKATIGVGYKPIESLVLSFETEKRLAADPIYRAGIEFSLSKNFKLRTGISSASWENSFGTGFKFKGFMIDLSVCRNPILGYSPGCSISYEF
jgi:hypothetical protein